MQITFRTPDFLVLDDFLDEDQFRFLWNFFQEERFRSVHDVEWTKAFRLADGQPLWGNVYTSQSSDAEITTLATTYPSSRGIDALIGAMLGNLELFAEYVGGQGVDWDYFFCRPYLYPVGAGLSWHTDGRGDVSGAYVFYAHPEWNAHWGAELLIDASGNRELNYPELEMYDGSRSRPGLHLDWRLASAAVMHLGIGQYVTARPNRLVILRPGLLHRINPVHHSAGDHIRASVTGFFLRDSED